MARPLRIEFAGALYHVLSRGNGRQRIYQSDADQERFVALLAESSARFEVGVQAFVLMGNHFHLLVQTRRANLSRWMHWLMVAYSVYFNRGHRRSGHLLQGRYKSLVVEEGEYLLELSRYLHLNPVRGAVLGRGTPVERRKRLRQFAWSSYRGYAGVGKQWSFIEEELVLGELGGGARGRRLRYRRFVEEGLVREIANPFEAVRWQALLGSEAFGQKVLDRVRGRGTKREASAPLRAAAAALGSTLGPEEVVAWTAKKYGIAPQRLMSRGDWGLAARNIAMWLIWERCDLSLAGIGKLFGGLDYAAVAQRIRRARLSSSEKKRKQLLHEILNIKI
jgi:putative transposase